jgi:hypothetical protein
MTVAVFTLLNTLFQTFMHGHLWDNALQLCIANHSDAQKNPNFNHLTLGMVNASALGKIIDMSSRRYPTPSSMYDFVNMEFCMALGELEWGLGLV